MDLVDNAERLVEIFGKWPSFHDAEVLRLTLDRSGPDGPTLDMQIHVFQMTSEVSPSGHYALENHTLATIRCTGIELSEIVDFNQQNVLFGLAFSSLDPETNAGRRVAVNLHGTFGVSAVFECKRCQVADVQPYERGRSESGTDPKGS